jgi:hypothetical protein
MTRNTESGAGKGGSRVGPRPATSHGTAAAADGVSVALAALHVLRAELRQALARVETAIAEVEGPPAGAATRNQAPDGPQGTTARPKRPAPLREKGERGRRAPVLPGRRTPLPRGPATSPETPGEGT